MTDIELVSGEKQPGENIKSIQACNDYLRMGPGRSLAKLLNYYQDNTELPPVKTLKTLKKWSVNYRWVNRATAYDAEIERQKNEAIAKQRRKILESGLALDTERIKVLSRITNLLQGQVFETDEAGKQPKLWPKYGTTENGQDLRKFNSALIRELRGLLDDLAKEVGGRRQRSDNVNINLDDLSDEQLERIANGEDPLYVVATTSQSDT